MAGFFKRDRTGPPRSVKKLINDYELPSFPGAILRSLELIRDIESPADEIAKAIHVDPGLSVGVLRLVNSAAFGLRAGVDNLTSAVTLIGRTALEPLLISMGLREVLPQKTFRGFDPRRFWRTSAQRATTARALAQILCPPESSQSFTAGLLQDLAIPLLVEHMPDGYGALLEQWHRGEGLLHELEREAYGWDHAEVASAICQRWDLPEALTRTIAEHHALSSPEAGPPSPVMLSALIRESEESDGVQELIDAAHQEYVIEVEDLKQLVDSSFEAAEEVSALLA